MQRSHGGWYGCRAVLGVWAEASKTLAMKNKSRANSNPSQCETTSSPTYVMALLCLGSLGDCLPLCALAASLPSHLKHCHSVGDIKEKNGNSDNIARRSPPSKVAERVNTINEDDLDCHDGIGNIGTTAAAAARCVIVTHRCHCDLLRGKLTHLKPCLI